MDKSVSATATWRALGESEVKAPIIGGVRVCAWRTCKEPIPGSRSKSPYCGDEHANLARERAFSEGRWRALLERQFDDLLEGTTNPPQFLGYFSTHEGTFIDGRGTQELVTLAEVNRVHLRKIREAAAAGDLEVVKKLLNDLERSPMNLATAVKKLVTPSIRRGSRKT